MNAENTIISLFGRKASGKSTLAARMCREWDRVIVLDTLGEYPFRVCFGSDACFEALEQTEGRPRFKLSLRCEDVDDMLALLGICYHVPDCLVVVEETSFYCSPAQLPPELSTLVRYGRHRGISQLYIARRPSEVHRDLTAQSDIIVTFRQHEPRDLDYLSQSAGSDISNDVRSLPPYRVEAWGPAPIEDYPLALVEALHSQPKGGLTPAPAGGTDL